MTAAQKYAWFNLMVIAVTCALVAITYPFLGHRAFGCFGMLGLLGLDPLFFRKKPGRVVADERDHLIWAQATLVAFAVFWLAFTLSASVLVPAVYGWDGALPVTYVCLGVAGGFMLFLGVQAATILVRYAQGY